jgi:hypothetical protein
VHRTALDWLKADRDGICIVNPKMVYSQLHHEERLIFSDAVYAAQVRKWMKPPETRSQFLVEIEEEAA